MRSSWVALVALILVACGSGTNAAAVIASSPGTVGVGEQQRVMVGLIDQETAEALASPEIEVVATLRDRNGSPLGEYQGQFIWTVPQVRGLYTFYLDIPDADTYQLTFEAGELGGLGPVGLVAAENLPMVSRGDEAPRSKTRTSADHDISVISSDPDPDPSFYTLSVDEAIDSGPSVIIFATPAWCMTQTCGPLLDQVKDLSAEFPQLNFVHVEVYQDIQVESFEQLELVEAVLEWGLPTEPWVFVTDADGVVTAAFEGAASDEELRGAFEKVNS